MPGARRLLDVVRVSGPAEGAIRQVLGDAWIADDFETARVLAAQVRGPVATLDGEVLDGLSRVEGGTRAEARGILTTKREIKELRERGDAQRLQAERLREAVAVLDELIASTSAAIGTLQQEQHQQEKATVGFDLQVGNARNGAERVARKQDQIANERRTCEEEMRVQDARQQEAQASIARIEHDQRDADAQLNEAQRRLFEARERMQAQSARPPRPRRSTPVWSSGPAGSRLRSAASKKRAASWRPGSAGAPTICSAPTARIEELRGAVIAGEAALDAGLRAFDDLREQVRTRRRALGVDPRGVHRAREPDSRGTPAGRKPCAPKPRASTWPGPPRKPT